jgi:hypothetical protein
MDGNSFIALAGRLAALAIADDATYRTVSAVGNCREDDLRETICQAIAAYEQKIRPS